jgi:hypothetical protein
MPKEEINMVSVSLNELIEIKKDLDLALKQIRRFDVINDASMSRLEKAR